MSILHTIKSRVNQNKHTEMSKTNAREGVSNNKLKDTGENQQQSIKKNQDSPVSSQQGSRMGSEKSYVNAAPPPPAPLYAIKQQQSGEVANTNAPSPLWLKY